MKQEKHWTDFLSKGDEVIATIRHKSDHKKNRHGVRCIVVSVHRAEKKIMALDTETNKEVSILFDVLWPAAKPDSLLERQVPPHSSDSQPIDTEIAILKGEVKLLKGLLEVAVKRNVADILGIQTSLSPESIKEQENAEWESFCKQYDIKQP